MNDHVIINTKSLILDLKVRLRSFARRIEMDRTVLYAILARVWGVAAGPVTALLIANKFTPVVQGFYFTFGSILAMQMFAELGIGLVIAQFASHEWANLRIDENGRVAGDLNSLSRLASLAQMAIKWYFVAAIVVVVGLSFSGYVFFSQSTTQNINWKLPWIILCVLTGINLFSIAIWSLLEGCNQVSSVYSFRLFQGFLGSLTGWSAILLGANLWTASIVSFAGLIYASLFLLRKYWKFFESLLVLKSKGLRLVWFKDILPFQWRIALGWLSGYLIFYLFTPVLFHYHGPVVAGQMGMTWALCGAVSSIGGAWLGPRVPQLAMMAAQKKYAEMDRLFWKLLIIVTGITILGAVAVWLLIFGLNYYGFPLALRLLSPLPTALFLIAMIINTATCPMSTYMRAHKKEPILLLSIFLAIIISLSVWLLGRYYSALGIAIGLVTIFAIISLPGHIIIWQCFRVKWHNYPYNDK